MSADIGTSGMPKASLEGKQAARRDRHLMTEIRLWRMNTVFQRPAVAARKNNSAAALGGKVV